MVRSRFAAQMELLNTELIVMGTLCENALEHVICLLYTSPSPRDS